MLLIVIPAMGGTLTSPCRRKRSDESGTASAHMAMATTPVRPAANFCDEFFTTQQKVELRRTWKMLSPDLCEHGVRVFTHIFKMCPEAKQLFPFRNTTDEDLLKHPQFRSHGLRFMKVIGVAIDNLDTLDMVLIPSLTHLGKTHTKINGFCVEQFVLFMEAMDVVWGEVLGAPYSGELRETWVRMFSLITSTIREGYAEAHRNSLFTSNGYRPTYPRSSVARVQPSRGSVVTELTQAHTGGVILNGYGRGPVEFEGIPAIDADSPVGDILPATNHVTVLPPPH